MPESFTASWKDENRWRNSFPSFLSFFIFEGGACRPRAAVAALQTLTCFFFLLFLLPTWNDERESGGKLVMSCTSFPADANSRPSLPEYTTGYSFFFLPSFSWQSRRAIYLTIDPSISCWRAAASGACDLRGRYLSTTAITLPTAALPLPWARHFITIDRLPLSATFFSCFLYSQSCIHCLFLSYYYIVRFPSHLRIHSTSSTTICTRGEKSNSKVLAQGNIRLALLSILFGFWSNRLYIYIYIFVKSGGGGRKVMWQHCEHKRVPRVAQETTGAIIRATRRRRMTMFPDYARTSVVRKGGLSAAAGQSAKIRKNTSMGLWVLDASRSCTTQSPYWRAPPSPFIYIFLYVQFSILHTRICRCCVLPIIFLFASPKV